MTDIVKTADAGQLVPARNTIDSFKRLDIYNGQVEAEQTVDWLATITAGERGSDGLPKRTKEGEIYIHDPEGRAPGLKQALEANGWKQLTIAFPSHDPTEFIQMRFCRYSRTRLEAFGDESSITVTDDKGTRTVYEAGSPGYVRERATCKVVTSVFFLLSEWQPDSSSAIVLPDGLSPYRLKFQSVNSLRNLIAQLRDTAKRTGDALAGIPFNIRIVFRDASDGKGVRHRVPVWTFTFKPPETIRFTSRTFVDIVERSLAEGAGLMLPAPRQQTFEQAAAEGPEVDLDEPDPSSRFVPTVAGVVDTKTGEVLPARRQVIEGSARAIQQPSDQEVDIIARGGHCDAERWNKRWHATVAGTRFAQDEERWRFIGFVSREQTHSLAEFLSNATEQEAAELIAEVEREIAADKSEEDARLAQEADDARLAELAEQAEAQEPVPAPAQPTPEETERRRARKGVASAKCTVCGTEVDPAATYLYKGRDVTGQQLINTGLLRCNQVRCTVHLPDRDVAQVGGK